MPLKRLAVSFLLVLGTSFFAIPSLAYDVDVHFGVTKFLAEAVGIPPAIADQMAHYAQAVDDDPATSPVPWLHQGPVEDYVRALWEFHFVNVIRLEEMRRTAFPPGCHPRQIGGFLHAAADSFSHIGYSWPLGHALAIINPDKTTNAVEQALNMAHSMLRTIAALATKCYPGQRKERSFSSIEDQLRNFFASEKDGMVSEKLKILVPTDVGSYVESWQAYTRWKKGQKW